MQYGSWRVVWLSSLFHCGTRAAQYIQYEKFQKNSRSDTRIQNIGSIGSVESNENIESFERIVWKYDSLVTYNVKARDPVGSNNIHTGLLLDIQVKFCFVKFSRAARAVSGDPGRTDNYRSPTLVISNRYFCPPLYGRRCFYIKCMQKILWIFLSEDGGVWPRVYTLLFIFYGFPQWAILWGAPQSRQPQPADLINCQLCVEFPVPVHERMFQFKYLIPVTCSSCPPIFYIHTPHSWKSRI